jgi:hypothetical protein
MVWKLLRPPILRPGASLCLMRRKSVPGLTPLDVYQWQTGLQVDNTPIESTPFKGQRT